MKKNVFRKGNFTWKKLLIPAFCALILPSNAQEIPFAAKPLEEKGDLPSLMVEGIDRFLTSKTEQIKEAREGLWQRDFSGQAAFDKSIASHRNLLALRLGVVDQRVAPEMKVLTNDRLQQMSLETDACIVRAVRWEVLEGRYESLSAEGLLLQPKGKVVARAVIIPDADVVPEVLAGLQGIDSPGYGVARQLAEAGWEVLVPVLVNRQDTFSGSELIGRYTNQPHREWIYRQGFVVGRHIIGYELQKIFAAIDWLEKRNKAEGSNVLIGVAGYGEGGMLALQAAALDKRISSTLTSGYFNAREEVWREPIYRNVFGLLENFGDAELAVMAWPRNLVVEHSEVPEVSGPPPASRGRSGAAPGKLTTPDFKTVKSEWDRARKLSPEKNLHLHFYANGNSAFKEPFSSAALKAFAKGLKVDFNARVAKKTTTLPPPSVLTEWINETMRQERTVRDIEQHVQRIIKLSERSRNSSFWQTLDGNVNDQKPVKDAHRERFWEVIGRLPDPSVPANTEARLLQKTEKWTSYEVKLDVWPGVFAWGILLVPNDLKPGEKRPVVVCQHGLEGLPMDVITSNPQTRAFRAYKGFAAQLAERGYVTFAPFNPYRGEDKFRVLQRKANPLGLSLFSVITGQHQRIVEWLGEQSFIDASRIAFYGLSYGGKTAMRIPALVEGYTLSICSADFNEWVRKVGSTGPEAFNSYPFTKEYEIPEWDLGHTFNYAEMAALIAPRPFMVERGHKDGVGTDEWVNYEFAKVRRHYNFLGLPQAIRIEHFDGPHTINGVGTFEFLDHHLNMMDLRQ
jgi:dienelactone hydrolase